MQVFHYFTVLCPDSARVGGGHILLNTHPPLSFHTMTMGKLTYVIYIISFPDIHVVTYLTNHNPVTGAGL